VPQGTADAVRQYAWLFRDIKNRNVEDIVILSGDHLYRMDYMKVRYLVLLLYCCTLHTL
jgi:ADP-glucose pyrophosphorylase